MKHDTTLPTQPPSRFYSYLLYFYDQFFYIIYLIYFPVEIQTVLAPVYFSHT